MSTISFADVVHQSVTFETEIPHENLVLNLIDTRWVQRLRDISQTANTRLVYMFSEHSRFGHSVGVAYLACLLMKKLKIRFPKEIEPYEAAVAAAAILHDLGHIAPGSHTAYKTWYPDAPDVHEEVGMRIIQEDPHIQRILTSFNPEITKQVVAILNEDDSVPAWTWEIISGGGWNVDRGNWCMVDSILAGVRYGEYNIPALIDSMVLTSDKHLALQENRLDAMMHFAVSRHAMYRQIYQHRVILAADTLNKALVMRLRDAKKGYFADPVMEKVINSSSPFDLSLDEIDAMRESWWRYHCHRWLDAEDPVIKDLASRILDRRLLKTVRARNAEDEKKIEADAVAAFKSLGLDPKYYLHKITTSDVHTGDSKHSMPVMYDDGKVKSLFDSEPLFQTLVGNSEASKNSNAKKIWFVMPGEVKEKLGRVR